MTKTDWTKEEVRAVAKDVVESISCVDPLFKARDMLTAFAERIEADEGAVPACWRYYNSLGEVVSEWIDGVPPDRHFDLCNNDITDQITIERAFTRPPAQEQSGWKVPEKKTSLQYQDARYRNEAIGYRDGWNECCDAMLAASPTPPKEK